MRTSPGARLFTIQNSLFPISSSRGLTKIRTYALISRVRHGATVKDRIREAAFSAGAGGKLSRDGGKHSTVGLRSCAAGSAAARRRRPTTSSARRRGAASKSKTEKGRATFLPYKPIHLNLYQISGLYHFRIATQASSALLLRVLSLFAANQLNCLPMNNLHIKRSFFDQPQSRQIKANQDIFLNHNARQPITQILY